MMHKTILSLEASTQAVSVALFIDGKCVADDFLFKPKLRHSETLLTMIDDTLKNSKVTIDEVEAVCVSRGPGSFTSVRIGLATALGLAFPRELPVYPVSTLDVLAAGTSSKTPFIMPMMDARKGEVYAALYKTDSRLFLPVIDARAQKAIDWIIDAKKYGDEISIFGDGVAAYMDDIKDEFSTSIKVLENGQIHPKAKDLGELVLQRLENNIEFPQALPEYLRKPEAEVNLLKKLAQQT